MITIQPANNTAAYTQIENLAKEIIPEVYQGILNKKAIDYMIESYHSALSISKEVLNERNLYYLLNYDSTPIGYLSLNIFENSIKLNQLYICENYRGKKIGSTAINFVEQTAINNKINTVELKVQKLNQDTIDIYLYKGFKINQSLSRQLENGQTITGYHMVKKLT